MALGDIVQFSGFMEPSDGTTATVSSTKGQPSTWSTPSAGNLLVCMIWSGGGTITPPAGWTQRLLDITNGNLRRYIYEKVSDGSETSLTVTFAVTEGHGMVLYELEGVPVFDKVASARSDSSVTSVASGSTGTLTGATSTALVFSHHWNASNTSFDSSFTVNGHYASGSNPQLYFFGFGSRLVTGTTALNVTSSWTAGSPGSSNLIVYNTTPPAVPIEIDVDTAAETDGAQPIAAHKPILVPVGQATESDAAGAVEPWDTAWFFDTTGLAGGATLNVGRDANNHWHGNVVVPSGNKTVSRIDVSAEEVGTIAGGSKWWVEIWDDASSTPGALIEGGTSTELDPSTFGSGMALRTFYFPSRPQLSSGSRYYFIVKFDHTVSTSNYARLQRNSTGGEHWRIASNGTETQFFDVILMRIQSMSGPLTGIPVEVNVGVATESDDGLGVAAVKTIYVPVGLASESDAAQVLQPVKTIYVPVGQASESSAALEMTPVLDVSPGEVLLGWGSETDAALPIQIRQTMFVPVGQASETDEASGFAVAVVVFVEAQDETDEAFPITAVKTIYVPVGQADEADVAFTVRRSTALTVGQAVEVDEGLPVTMTKAVVMGQAVSFEEALFMWPEVYVPPGPRARRGYGLSGRVVAATGGRRVPARRRRF